MRSRSARLWSLPLLAAIALSAPACGNGSSDSGPTLAVLSAFPAELVAVLELATVEETRTVEGRVFRLGHIGRTRVVIGMTGIALVNARDTTRILLDSFDVDGVVISGVAGSPLHVGDVTVPASWSLDDGSHYEAHAPWLELAAEIASDGEIALEHCAIIPDVVPIPGVTPGATACFDDEARVVVGGFGSSSDPFGDDAYACIPGGNDVFACDTDDPGAFAPVSVGPESVAALERIDAGTQAAYDMETAAIGREVVARGLPFIAFRASSDGGPDPYDLEGFTEFFAYYRLAAHNAAAATAAFVARAG